MRSLLRDAREEAEKKERRESTHTGVQTQELLRPREVGSIRASRVCTACVHREETHVRAEGVEIAGVRDGERKRDGPVCMYHQKSVPDY